ncbi:hypothetical protein Tco_0222388 [Tanacetum coccineum]
MATSQQSATMLESTGTLERDNMRPRGMLSVERQRVDRLQYSMSYVQRDLRQICRFRFYDCVRTMLTSTRSGITQDEINKLISKRVEEALKAYDIARNPGTKMEMEDDQQDDNVEANGDNGNTNGNGNENGNPNVNNEGVLTLLGTKMVPKDEDKVDRYIGGLPDNIQGNVIAAESIRL